MKHKTSIRPIPSYTFKGCPATRHHTRRCLRICDPDEEGSGSCGRVAPHSVNGRIQQAVIDYNKRSK